MQDEDITGMNDVNSTGRLGWVTPELRQQSVAGTANGPDNGEDFVVSSAIGSPI